MSYQRGDIIELPFLIPGKNKTEVHPAVIVSNEIVHQTEEIYICVMITHSDLHEYFAFDLLPEMFSKEKEVAQHFPDSSKYMEKMYYGKKTKVYTDEFAKQYAAALGTSINKQLINSANMVSDFWYSAWIDAGKPNLNSLCQFNKKEKKKLCKELKSYKKNKLVKKIIIKF